MTTDKTKQTYIAALYGITPVQQKELVREINKVWSRMHWDVVLMDSEPHWPQIIELCVDADRLTIIGDIGDWWRGIDNKMYAAFDVMDVKPCVFYKKHAKQQNIEMWTLRN